MALIISGKTTCPLCHEILQKGEEIVAFPAIISNQNDPLHQLNDTAFHAQCFANHPLAAEAERRYAQWKSRTAAGRKCYLCSQAITNPDDHFQFVHFTADVDHPLFAYNFREFHQSCLASWRHLPYIIEEIEKLNQSGTWQGAALDNILEALRRFEGSRIPIASDTTVTSVTNIVRVGV